MVFMFKTDAVKKDKNAEFLSKIVKVPGICEHANAHNTNYLTPCRFDTPHPCKLDGFVASTLPFRGPSNYTIR